MPTSDVCRKHGTSSATFYKYKSKFGGLEAPDARRLRSFEQENARLKKLLADQMLDNTYGYSFCVIHGYSKHDLSVMLSVGSI